MSLTEAVHVAAWIGFAIAVPVVAWNLFQFLRKNL